jgi:hypothetical protein
MAFILNYILCVIMVCMMIYWHVCNINYILMLSIVIICDMIYWQVCDINFMVLHILWYNLNVVGDACVVLYILGIVILHIVQKLILSTVSKQTRPKPREDDKRMSRPPNHDQSPDLTHRGVQTNVLQMWDFILFIIQ